MEETAIYVWGILVGMAQYYRQIEDPGEGGGHEENGIRHQESL